ncbi:MAG: helix-turn-helix domain-containing protein [Muribaculaceae bacterium]
MALLAAIPIWSGCVRSGEVYNEIHLLPEKCRQYAKKGDFSKSDSLAMLLLQYSERNGDTRLKAHALYYLGVYNGSPQDAPTRLAKLHECEELLHSSANDTLLLMIYNALGIYEAKYFRRYSIASNYIYKSWKMARALGDDNKAIVAVQNLSAIMVFLDDTLGIQYDREILQYASQKNDSNLIYASAVHCGIYYSMRCFNEDKALYYASLIKNYPKSTRYYEILGNIAYSKKLYNKAFDCYRQSIAASGGSSNYTSMLRCAMSLHHLGRYNESIEMTHRAENAYLKTSESGTVPEFSKLYADNLYRLNRLQPAFASLEKYINLNDSLRESLHREAIEQYRVMYDTEAKENRLALEHLRVRNLRIVLWLIFIASIIIVTIVVWYYESRQRMYKRIVRHSKNLLSIETGNASSSYLESPAGSATSDDDNAVPTSDDKKLVTEEKVNEIYQKLHNEVIEKQAYRDVHITRDTLSERCGCNHTYLTHVIKVKLGMSYTQYMNSVRIHEALRKLSDNSCQDTIKQIAQEVGFLSDKNFFVVFKNQVGMSPTAYRRIAQSKAELPEEDNNM